MTYPFKRRQLLYEDAIDFYGEVNQCVKAIEEMAELQKELGKYIQGIGDTHHIAEEIADCRIMLEQVALITKTEKEADAVVDRKCARLWQRIFGGD